MSRKFEQAGAVAVAAMIVTVLAGANGSGAAAQSATPVPLLAAPSLPIDQQLETIPQQPGVVIEPLAPEVIDPILPAPSPVSPTLAALVSAQPQPGELSRELNCLAGAIFFEAKSESLAGQLAVGRVVVARSKSGRFPDSYCGVVFQRSQFSFVRGSAMPAIPKASRQWKNAVAVAQIAHAGSWRSPAEGALFFHAARVSPGWRLARVAKVDNHIFYR